MPQDETTPFYPRSPYAAAKLYGYWIMVNYREAYGLHASNGVLFNHESPRRGETFVTRKITRAVAAISLGTAGLPLARQPRRAARLGPRARLSSRACGACSSRTSPTTTCSPPARPTRSASFSTSPSARSASRSTGAAPGVEEVGVCRRTGRELVRVDPAYFRPTEVDLLIGNPAKAKRVLGWSHTVELPELAAEMVAARPRRVERIRCLTPAAAPAAEIFAAARRRRIFVAGHRGMVGAACARHLAQQGA